MAISGLLAPLSAVLRLAAAVFKTAPIAEKNLKTRIVTRGIVAELPSDMPLKIVDEFGHHHQGVYALSMLIWNLGSEAILPSSFLENAPLRIALSEDAYILDANCFSNDDQLICVADKIDERTVSIDFDCINPSDFIMLVMFYGGKPMTNVHITGRILGQAASIDQTAEEVRAAPGERIAALLILLLSMNVVTGFPVCAWLIYRGYSLAELFKAPSGVPAYLIMPVAMGVLVLSMFAFSRIDAWLERRKYPNGFPLSSDFEPPLWENLKGLARTVFHAKKQRLSTSMFDWAQPVIFRPKKTKRLTVDDWMV